MAKETAAPAQSAPELYVSSPGRPPKETTFREWVVVNQIGKISTNNTMPCFAAQKALDPQLPAQLLPGSFGMKNTFPRLTLVSALQESR